MAGWPYRRSDSEALILAQFELVAPAARGGQIWACSVPTCSGRSGRFTVK